MVRNTGECASPCLLQYKEPVLCPTVVSTLPCILPNWLLLLYCSLLADNTTACLVAEDTPTTPPTPSVIISAPCSSFHLILIAPLLAPLLRHTGAGTVPCCASSGPARPFGMVAITPSLFSQTSPLSRCSSPRAATRPRPQSETETRSHRAFAFSLL